MRLADSAMENMSEEKKPGSYGELLANIRRLTIMVLDNLETGTRDRTLDQSEKRLLSSTGTRLLRLWTAVQREGGSQKAAMEVDGIAGALARSERGNQEPLEE